MDHGEGSMTFAPATIAPMKYLHAKPNKKSIYQQNHYPYNNPHIKLNLKPYHNPNPNPNSSEKLRPEQIYCRRSKCRVTIPAIR